MLREAGSLNGLGYMYMHGMGVERSLEKANRYFHKAAHEKGTLVPGHAIIVDPCHSIGTYYLLVSVPLVGVA